VTRIQAYRQKRAQTNRQTDEFTDRWIQKLTDNWPGSRPTQTKISFKSACIKVNFQFYIRRCQLKPTPLYLRSPNRLMGTWGLQVDLWGRLARLLSIWPFVL